MKSGPPKLRDDLIFQDRETDEGTVWFVKDPIRAQFYRFNDLQVSIMHLLDGRRTLEEISGFVFAEQGVEMPADRIEALVERLKRYFLLDISAYQIDEEKVRRSILRQLRRRTLFW